MYTFPELIKNIRNEAGLTQAEFANELDVSKVLITMVEGGQREVSKSLVEKLASRLNVSPISITPFLFSEGHDATKNITGLEKGIIDFGTKLQEYLIKDRAKLLRKSNETKKLSQNTHKKQK